jgi:RNA polymerase sigma-70 factor (ECF subfamily)
MYPLVARVVGAYLPRGLDADDWHQEVFLRMFLRLEQFRGNAPFEHWLARLAVNVCLDQLRQRRRRGELRWADLSERETDLLRSSLAATPTEGDALLARELVEKLLAELPAEDQLVLKMLDLEQHTVAETAALLARGQS